MWYLDQGITSPGNSFKAIQSWLYPMFLESASAYEQDSQVMCGHRKVWEAQFLDYAIMISDLESLWAALPISQCLFSCYLIPTLQPEFCFFSFSNKNCYCSISLSFSKFSSGFLLNLDLKAYILFMAYKTFQDLPQACSSNWTPAMLSILVTKFHQNASPFNYSLKPNYFLPWEPSVPSSLAW